jgi:hypothetical protein
MSKELIASAIAGLDKQTFNKVLEEIANKLYYNEIDWLSKYLKNGKKRITKGSLMLHKPYIFNGNKYFDGEPVNILKLEEDVLFLDLHLNAKTMSQLSIKNNNEFVSVATSDLKVINILLI